MNDEIEEFLNAPEVGFVRPEAPALKSARHVIGVDAAKPGQHVVYAIDEMHVRKIQPWQDAFFKSVMDARIPEGKVAVISTALVARQNDLAAAMAKMRYQTAAQTMAALTRSMMYGNGGMRDPRADALEEEGWSSPERTKELERAVQDAVDTIEAAKAALREMIPLATASTAFDLCHLLGRLESPPVRERDYNRMTVAFDEFTSLSSQALAAFDKQTDDAVTTIEEDEDDDE